LRQSDLLLVLDQVPEKEPEGVAVQSFIVFLLQGGGSGRRQQKLVGGVHPINLQSPPAEQRHQGVDLLLTEPSQMAVFPLEGSDLLPENAVFLLQVTCHGAPHCPAS
jgi:hypothetical protein